MSKCPTCKRAVPEKPIVEDQSRNGVRVIVRRFTTGTTVDADCQCFGSEHRAHSREDCPNRLRRIEAA